MSKTLILLFHPDIGRSKANATLIDAASAVEGVEIVNMQALYPCGALDIERDGATEAARLLSADRIVLQFPVQWYSTPPLLKAWQDTVLTRMYYIANETEGSRLAGTPLLVAATAGNVPAAYSPAGQNLFPLVDLLRPLEATAHRCGLPWAAPFLVYGTNDLNDFGPADMATRYAARLRRWIAATLPSRATA